MTKREARLTKNAKVRAANKAKLVANAAKPKVFLTLQVMHGKKGA